MTDSIDEFADIPYASLGVTMAGIGATMGSTLAVETDSPIRKHERAYVLLYAECPRLSFPDDKDGNQVRVAHLHPIDAYWVPAEEGRRLVAKLAGEREERKATLDGQLLLDQELAAEERERADLAATGNARSTTP